MSTHRPHFEKKSPIFGAVLFLHPEGFRRDKNIAHALANMREVIELLTVVSAHAGIARRHFVPTVQEPPRSTQPFFTSIEPVVSLLVQITSGVSRVIFWLAVTVTDGQVTTTDAEAVTSAILMPLTVSLPVSGSYSMTAPSGNSTRQPSADADGQQ